MGLAGRLVPVGAGGQGLGGFHRAAVGHAFAQGDADEVGVMKMQGDTEAGRDLDREPLQFELKRVGGGRSINSATFSRLRSTLDTSGSVLG